MAIVKAAQIVKAEVPDNLNDSLAIRCIDVKSGLSKNSGNMMITSSWEVVGYIDPKSKEVVPDMTVNGEKYEIVGQETQPFYQSLGSQRGIATHQKFWSKITGKPESEYEVDTDNPDISYYKGKVMSAVCVAKLITRTKPQTEQEIADNVKKVPIVDDEGNTLPPFKQLEIVHFNRLFTGEVPQF